MTVYSRVKTWPPRLPRTRVGMVGEAVDEAQGPLACLAVGASAGHNPPSEAARIGRKE